MGVWLCRGNDPTDFAGLILVKEVLQFWRCPETPRVSQLSMRPFPRLPADTPMFDMLRFFQVRRRLQFTTYLVTTYIA
jgi:metal transporter CNNM